MAVSQFAELWDRLDDLEAGLFRTPVGPGGIRNKMIRPKSITSGLIEVSSLQAVQSKTGSLSVTGGITMTTAGSFSAGQTAYDTGIGWWLDYNAGTPRLSLGNSGGSKLTWNGTTLAITGTITATSGTIGGWTIGTTDLQGSGGVIGLASSGSIRIWSGSATPSAAPFRVDSLGNLTATAGAIGGWTIDGTLGLKLGSGASTRGISTGATAFYAGSATPSTAPFSVDQAGGATMSNLTITGGSINLNGGVFSVSSLGVVTCSNITATGGTIGGVTINATSLSSTGWSLTNAGVMTSTSGTVGGLTIGANSLTIPAGKTLTNADGDTWSSTGITLVSAGAFGDSIKWINGGVDKGSIYADASKFYMAYASGGSMNLYSTGVLLLSANTLTQIECTNLGGVQFTAGSGRDIGAILGDSASANSFNVYNSGSTRVWGVNSGGDLIRPAANDATALGAYYGRVPIYINGTLKYLPVYS